MSVDSEPKVVELQHPAPALPRGRGKPRGYPRPPGSGRAKGTKNKRTLEVAEAMRPLEPKARRTLRELLEKADDPETQLRAAALVYAYIFGKPTERRELSGPAGGPIASTSDTRLSPAETVHEAALAIARAAPLVACQPKVRP